MIGGPEHLRQAVRDDGYVFVPAEAMRSRLGVAPGDWEAFAASWDDLPADEYMADGGRYRRRRFGVVSIRGDEWVVQSQQAHFQTVDHNRLNGGVERWFAPIDSDLLSGPVIAALTAASQEVFDLRRPASTPRRWRLELHQFRIEALSGAAGLPTPEGVHRDGVDWVTVMLVQRRNVASGVTAIFDPDQRPLGAFTLTEPMDAVFLDDHRVLHGVTAITPLDPSQPAYRDVLVATFREEA